MIAVGQKITEIINNSTSLFAVVERDIKQPFIKNKRTQWYFNSRKIYETIFELRRMDAELARLKELAQDCISEKLSIKKLEMLEAECTAYFSKLEGVSFSEEIDLLSNEEKGELFAEALYAETIIG